MEMYMDIFSQHKECREISQTMQMDQNIEDSTNSGWKQIEK